MPSLISRTVPELLRDTLRQLESPDDEQENSGFSELKRQIVRQLAELESSKNSRISSRPSFDRN